MRADQLLRVVGQVYCSVLALLTILNKRRRIYIYQYSSPCGPKRLHATTYHVLKSQTEVVKVFHSAGGSRDSEVHQNMGVQAHQWLIIAFLGHTEEVDRETRWPREAFVT